MHKYLIAILVAAATIVAHAVGGSPYGAYYGQRNSLFEALGVDSTSIVFAGNSITNFCEWHELLHNPNVVNRGISSDIVQGVEDRMTAFTDGQPAKIFLMIGVNDVSHELSADSIAGAILRLTGKIHKATPRTQVYLQSLLPINNSFGVYKRLTGREGVIRDINAILAANAAQAGATWIDLTPVFADENGNLRAEFTNDGLHLLAPGYFAWRDALQPYLQD